MRGFLSTKGDVVPDFFTREATQVENWAGI